ncbi:MAG: GH32 C-terminal domain-containing protein, partial [Candidatus Hydrogenedentes bacterium]|nr:GH32 C-terminal domain-containing protein [Candidatus Hydrogenedentota bacterium]
RTATGPNDKPGGSERLSWQSWDVSPFMGKQAVLRIVDKSTGGWGHINVDHIIQCDEPPVKELVMRLKIEKRYLNLPVKNGAEMRRMRIALDGATAAPSRMAREFDIELADGEPDFWVFCDMTPFLGREIEIHVDGMPKDSKALEAIALDDAIKGADDLYREKRRSQFHFSSRRGWNNDPNGLVYHNGEYHLYYQHNPYGWNWGNMHWGHAVSSDLVHWKELPIALYPKTYGDWCFSGSAVVDAANTAGFKSGGEDVIVAAFTSTGRGECIAYSNDRGRTFTDYEGNPVVKHAGRDPKVIWHAPTGRWVMAVYDEQEGKKNGIAFHTSPDLKHWEFQSRIEEYFECPEFFPLAVDGDAARMKWVVYAGSGEYSIGDFDGKQFKTEIYKQRFNWGNCFYASQTFNHIPPEDGRRIQIGWGTSSTPDMPFNQMMTFPCSLTLHGTDDGVRMFARPVKEIECLYTRTHTFEGRALAPDANPFEGIEGELFHIVADIELGDAKELTFIVRGTPVVYRVDKQELACADKAAPMKPSNGRIRLELLVDRTSIEVFGNDGAVYMPMGVIAPEDNRSLALHSDGTAKAAVLTVHELRSAWTLD